MPPICVSECVCVFYNNNFGKTYVILEQVTSLWMPPKENIIAEYQRD